MQGVTRAIADHSRTVRVPVHVHDTLGRIRKAKSKLLAEGSKASVQVGLSCLVLWISWAALSFVLYWVSTPWSTFLTGGDFVWQDLSEATSLSNTKVKNALKVSHLCRYTCALLFFLKNYYSLMKVWDEIHFTWTEVTVNLSLTMKVCLLTASVEDLYNSIYAR